MTDRLAELTARHRELSELLSQPETATDPALLARTGRELARLAPIVDLLAAAGPGAGGRWRRRAACWTTRTPRSGPWPATR